MPASDLAPPARPRAAGLVLTGFLGAGKTTLLNRLIAARAAAPAPGGKLGIIVNELGAIGVDGDLLPPGAARQVELPGGCVCCVLNEDLDRTVLELLDGNPEIDTVVIETTGVAEPLPIVWSLDRAPLAERVRVVAVVTVVDPLSFAAARAASAAAEIQVENADVVLLSKLDLAGPDQVAAARAALAELAPAAPVVDGTAEQQLDWLVGVLADPDDQLRRPAAGPPAHHHGGHGIDAVAVAADDLFDLEELEEALGELPPSYVRVKGLVRAVDPRTGSGAHGWAAVHRVGARVSSEPVRPPPGGGRVVALGPGVTEPPLRACLARAVVSCATTA